MRSSIVIDASHYRLPNPTGVERYCDSLLPLLVPALEASGASVTLLRSERLPASDILSEKLTIIPYRKGWGQLQVANFLSRTKHSLYFTPSGIPPLVTLTPSAVTVHDISIYESPESYGLTDRMRHMGLLRIAAMRAKLVLVPSAYVAETLIRRWKLKPEAVVVTPLALPEVTEMTQSKTDFDIDQIADPSFLFVGRVEEKKQLRQVIAGFSAYRDSGAAGTLVLAGKDGHGAEAIHSLAQKQRYSSSIIIPGFIDDVSRALLAGRACAWLVPSPYEGFGLPVLEAFASGVACVTASKGAVCEVGGDAVLRVTDDTAAGWKQAFIRISKDETLRATCISRGHERLKHYSWNQTATVTANAILKAARVVVG